MIILLVQLAFAIPFDKDVASQVFELHTPALFIFYSDSQDLQILQDLETNLLIVEADFSDKYVRKLCILLEVESHQLPSIKIIESKSLTQFYKYSYDDQFIFSKIQKFVTKYEEYQLVPDLKSEAIPLNPIEQGINKIVGHTYEQFVLDSTKDVLVYFYDDYCDLCIPFTQSLITLNNQIRQGKTQIKPSQFKIGKINSRLNEINDITITRLPTLYLYTINDKDQPILYEGDRTPEGMIKWILSQI